MTETTETTTPRTHARPTPADVLARDTSPTAHLAGAGTRGAVGGSRAV